MLSTQAITLAVGIGMIAAAVGILGRELYFEVHVPRFRAGLIRMKQQTSGHLHWLTGVALAFLAWGPLLIALSFFDSKVL
jgi:hypothetical protein